ncbi:hypothetical protein Mpsy_2417 [Methanolobus psychrophilus R15]|nr:hypothetical protein Mpsy_2417 [Methanolobus psychrophilus R15]
MIKIIDGKRYNTETSEEIANYENMHNCQDFNYYSETLYKTKKGAYFLYGSGMALSKYGRSNGRESYGGHEFEVMTPQEAFEWLTEHNLDYEAEEEFPEMIEEG